MYYIFPRKIIELKSIVPKKILKTEQAIINIFYNINKMVKISAVGNFIICALLISVASSSSTFVQKKFDSTVYGNKATIRYYEPPGCCKFQRNMPVTVFLAGLYVNVTEEASHITVNEVTETWDKMIRTGKISCSLLVIPQFELGPFGGYWYYNGPNSRPVDFLLLEVIPQIYDHYGTKVTKNTEQWNLFGHSMGGFGSFLIGFGQKYFGTIAGLNAANLAWNKPEGNGPILAAIAYEQELYSKSFTEPGCNYNTSEGYRFYGDPYTSPATYAVAGFSNAVFYDLENIRYDTPRLQNIPSEYCSTYVQTPYYQFVVTTKGVLQPSLGEQLTVDKSPILYVEKYGKFLRWASGKIFLSLGTQDIQVPSASIKLFSDTLTKQGINNKLFTYNGGHEDLIEPMKEYMKWLDVKMKRKPLLCGIMFKKI